MQPFSPVNTVNQGQVNDAQNTYNQNIGQAQTANQNLQSYQQNMQSGTSMYGQQLSGAEQQLGFNPAELSAAQKALATTQTTLANLPQAVQQQGNYYGATAGQEANNMAQAGGNLQGLLNGQVNQVGALGNIYQSTLAQAQAGTQAGQQGQQMQLGALQNIYSNAADQQKTALTQLQNLQQLFQQQGQFNADQARQYALAQATIRQTAATINQLNASAAQLQSQARFQNAQTNYALGNPSQAFGGAAPVAATPPPARNAAVQNYGNPAPNVLGSLANNFLGNTGGVPNVLRGAGSFLGGLF